MIELVLGICAIGCTLFGILVLFQDPRRLVNILAMGIMVCLAVWAIAIMLFLQAAVAVDALAYAKMYYVAAAVFVAFLALFSHIFPRGSMPSKSIMFAIALSCGSIIAALLLSPTFLTGQAIISMAGNFIIVDVPSYLLYCVYFVALFGYAIATIGYKFVNTTQKRLRAQTGLYFIGIAFMALPGFVTNLLLPYFQIYQYIWIGPAMSTLFLAATIYGVIRHGMFDVRLVAVRGLAYILSLGSLSLVYMFVAFLLSNLLLGQSFTSRQTVISVVLAVVLAFLFQPTKRFFDRLTNTIFYRDGYSKDAFYAQLNQALTATVDLRRLASRASQLIAKTLKASQVFVFVYYDTQYISAGTQKHSKLPIKDAHWLDEVVKKRPRGPIVIEDLSENERELRRFMISHKLSIVLPLMREADVMGYLCLGDHKSSVYTSRDIGVLETIADELAIATQNALSVQEIRELNATLQQRVDDATKELRASNDQLRRLDESKDEFISMASHQLRTPLTSIKGYVDMILEGDAGTVTPMQKQFLTEVFVSSERMVHLINDFLNVSRLQTGKFVIEKRPADLRKIVKQELDGLQVSAAQRNLKITFSASKHIPTLELDENKMRQVIMNFVDNALFYSPQGTTIKVELHRSDDGCVEFTVNDKGMGVPASEQARLFTKFYRASNARKQRPDGTGVGLYLAKKVITAHRGTVVFESQEGKGSTFGFSLPISSYEPLTARISS